MIIFYCYYYYFFLILRDSNIVLEWTGYRTLPEKVWSLKFASQTWAHFHYLGREKVALFTLVFLHITWVSRGGYPQSISLNIWGFPGSSVVKNTPANAGDAGYGRFDPWVGKISWRRKWQPTPIFLPGKPHEQGSLAVYSPWGHKESDMTEHSTVARYLISLLQGPSCSTCDEIKISVMMNRILQYQQYPKTVHLHLHNDT